MEGPAPSGPCFLHSGLHTTERDSLLEEQPARVVRQRRTSKGRPSISEIYFERRSRINEGRRGIVGEHLTDSMKKVSYFIFVAVLLATVIYLVFLKKPKEAIFTYVNTTIIQPAEPPIRRLSAFVDAHMDRIFSPLNPAETIMPRQEIRQIQETLIDLGKTANENDRRLYSTGVALCDQLLQAIDQREQHNRRLADCLAKKPHSLASQSDQDDDVERRWTFFHNAILSSWDTQSTSIRNQVDRQYGYMRLLER